MTLTVEQRALAQSDQTEIVVLGPNPIGAGDVRTLTEGAYKILGARPGSPSPCSILSSATIFPASS